MRRLLVTTDGTLVNPLQITTAKRTINAAAYEKDSIQYFRWNKEVKSSADPEWAQKDLDQAFPKGKPATKDYNQTLIRLSDGQSLWVDSSLDYVKDLMEWG